MTTIHLTIIKKLTITTSFPLCIFLGWSFGNRHYLMLWKPFSALVVRLWTCLEISSTLQVFEYVLIWKIVSTLRV